MTTTTDRTNGLIDQAAGIVRQLRLTTGLPWELTPRDADSMSHWVSFTDGDILLAVSRSRTPGRIAVDAHLTREEQPFYRSGGDSGRPTITVASDRPHEAIAKDVARRLIPQAREWVAKVRAAMADSNADLAARTALFERIKEVMPAARVAPQDKEIGEVSFYDPFWGRARLRTDGSGVSRLELDGIDTDTFLAILAILNPKGA